ncbi:class I SAM-dependent methyltransferase [Halomonas stenophila]|uniref:Ubiquinone/menaquinone biosynthesis C-methylase UbiE n=1 Tax=Halomonas stenophila TaxID=795312 RepID=A0A7W5EW41_9GAMM|nr:methyltransferase domain-containing protein [Halomonas stenophila]MBB3232562.1 ubiquinone/menaquinone biosynthesis C-methylase UbiE [Halomonas stenophila]
MPILDFDPIRDVWSSLAAGYDRLVTPTHLWLGNEALRRAGLASGMSFLDVACGSGALSLPAARLGARVTAVDLSPAMVERLEARARQAGIDTLQARVMDGAALQLDDDTFDMTGSQYGVMLFPDLMAGLAEMVRVTRPGGTVLVIALGLPEEVEFMRFMMDAIQAAVPEFPDLSREPPPLPFQIGRPNKLRHRLITTGLRDVRVERLTESLRFRSGQALWDWLMSSNPIPGQLVADLSQQQQARILEELDARVRDRAGNEASAVLTSRVNIGIGTKRD